MTVAVIDDIESDQHKIAGYIVRFLQAQAVPVPHFYFYHNGDAFIKELSPHLFDLVVLDYIMPGRDGLQTLSGSTGGGCDCGRQGESACFGE